MRLTDRFRSWRLRRGLDDSRFVPPANAPRTGLEVKPVEPPTKPRNRAERRALPKLIRHFNRVDMRKRLSMKGQSRGRYTPPRVKVDAQS